jgi:hypothetical protein
VIVIGPDGFIESAANEAGLKLRVASQHDTLQ